MAGRTIKTMKSLLKSTLPVVVVAWALGHLVASADESPPPRPETLEESDGTLTSGRLMSARGGGLRFVAETTKREIPLQPGTAVQFRAQGPTMAAGMPPYRVELGLGQRLWGRLGAVNDKAIQLLDPTGEGKLSIARGGALALVQRPGENQVLEDGFESLESRLWKVTGAPSPVEGPRVAGSHSLRLPAGGTKLTHKLKEPVGSGRLEVAFHDNEVISPGQQWILDMTFRGQAATETLRTYLGWSEESLAVETPGGPALAVQRLARKAGWHRLAVRFGPESCEVSVDGNELAHGKGFDGPLVEVEIATASLKGAAPEGLAGHVDDLRVVRFAEPVGGLEIDASQDEVRLTGGDQLFGKLGRADGEKVELTVDGRATTFSWGEVAGIYFTRDATPGAPISGLLVRLEWRAAPGTNPRDVSAIEGAVASLSPTTITLATPYAGSVGVPRERLTSLRVLGRGRRLVIDPFPHHLGDEISTAPPLLDPPQPEGGVLERTIDLPDVPVAPAFLVLDVVQVVGEAPDLPFSNLVKKGELRTNVKMNGEPFDYLNRRITSKNETPERIRLPIPKGLLHPGKNVLRFEQAGIESDPNYLDDLGVLTIALEFAKDAPAANSR
jgi:hypothetical protein